LVFNNKHSTCYATLHLTCFCYAALLEWWRACGKSRWKASRWQSDNTAGCVPTYVGLPIQ
jgi:hypothetical protein